MVAQHSHSLVTISIPPDTVSVPRPRPTRSTIPVGGCFNVLHRSFVVTWARRSTGTCVNVGATLVLKFKSSGIYRWTLPVVSHKSVLHEVRVTRMRNGGVRAVFKAIRAGHARVTAQDRPPDWSEAPASTWTLSLLVDR
jgi:hypothetical protein